MSTKKYPQLSEYLDYYTSKLNKLSTNIFNSPITITSLIAHLNQVEYSTLASARPPIIAPQVGVIKLTKPFAATIVIIETSTLYPSSAASGAIIGVESVASPLLDGTKNESTT